MKMSDKGIQEIIDSLPFYVILVDSSHHIQMANKAVKTVLKVEPEQIIGGYCPKLIHGIDSAFPGCPLEEAIEKGHSVEKELYDQTYKHWLLSAVYQTTLKTEDGKTIYFHMTRDITDKKQAEHEIIRVNKTLLTLSECNQVLIRAADESKLLNDICRIIVEIGGYRLAWVGFAEKDKNKTLRVVAQAGYEEGYLENINITWADTERGRGPTGTAIRTREPVIIHNILSDPHFLPWRDEAIKRGYASSMAIPLISNQETFGALNIYAQEPDAFTKEEVKLLKEMAEDLAYGITVLRMGGRQVQLEEELRQSQKMESIGTLAGGIAHDFNNLLTAITGYGGLLLGQFDKDDAKREDVGEILKAAKRASLLTQQLLTFSRKQILQQSVLNLNIIVKETENMLHRLLGEDVELVALLDSELKRIKADRSQMEQVIMNMMVNARDAMPKGGKITIKTENVIIDDKQLEIVPGSYAGQFIRLSIEDTGTGMDKETVKHIFEPFYTTKGAGKGTGLGLSVIYGIIKQHNGWINTYSEIDRGTIFKMYLPVYHSKDEEVLIKEEVPIEDLKGKGERILLVEDEEAICRYVKRLLTNNGYVVFDAQNTKDAEIIFNRESKKVDLVISDMVLPDKTGLELVDKLLSNKPELRIMFISGYLNDKAQWPVIKNRGFKFLQKPFEMNELLIVVRETLNKNK